MSQSSFLTQREFSEHFNFKEDELKAFVEYYNADYSKYGNEVYSKVESRIAHWLNFQENGWFQQRINHYLDLVEGYLTEKVLVIDIGFSAPYAYRRKSLEESEFVSFLFVDKEPSAIAFSKELVVMLDLPARKLDQFLVADVESAQGVARILQEASSLSSSLKPLRILVVASEVLEHLKDQKSFWNMCRDLGQLSNDPIPVSVYVTLPVGCGIPSHTCEFLDLEAAKTFLNNEMTVVREWLVQPPTNIDKNPFLSACFCAEGVLDRTKI